MTAKQLRIKELEVALLDERSQTTAASVGLDELRVHYNLAISEIGSLVHQLNLIHNSRTWKLGRLALFPLRAIRKVVRFLKGDKIKSSNPNLPSIDIGGSGMDRQAEAVMRLFDSDWYLKMYPDVADSGVNPLVHYLDIGGFEGRDPSPLFDSDWYLKTYPDVADLGVNPLVHYAQNGGFEGRDPSPLFDSWWYRGWYPDVADSGVNPLVHFIESGSSSGRHPAPLLLVRTLPQVPGAWPKAPTVEMPVEKSIKPRATIIIPVHGEWHWTERCLRSLEHTEASYLAEVVVVDDASSDETIINLQRFSWVKVLPAPINLGFTKACNFGAAGVTTEFILFLNNDTEVLPGFLTSMFECMDSESDVGIVGSKLIYPDGTLQEAGSIIWNDGTGHNYGKHEDINNFKYLTPRNVDYCSGASILVRTQLFRRLGGFDEQYAPAYYEDVDLSFQARAIGFHTRYEPNSVVIHHEGGSHGRDVTVGLKAYQVSNRDKFCKKWKTELTKYSAPGSISLQAASQSGHMVRQIVLWVEPSFITPQKDAGSLRTFEILLLLKDMGLEIFHLSEYDDPLGSSADFLRRSGMTVLAGKKHAQELLDDPSYFVAFIVVARAASANSWFHWIRAIHAEIPVLFDTVDLHHVRELKQAEIEKSEAIRLRSIETRRIELFLLNNVDATIVVSEKEKQYLEELSPDSKIVVVGTIHRLVRSVIPFSERRGLLFVGSFAHTPNADAVEWLVENVWEHLSPKIKEDGLDIIGKNPPEHLVKNAPKGIRFHGWVESTDPYVDNARLSIAPIRFGAGIKGKIGEAWARGLPVVGTSIAFDGMINSNSTDFYSSDDPVKLAELVNLVYSSEDIWTRASKAGQEQVEKTLSPEVARVSLTELINSLKL